MWSTNLFFERSFCRSAMRLEFSMEGAPDENVISPWLSGAHKCHKQWHSNYYVVLQECDLTSQNQDC